MIIREIRQFAADKHIDLPKRARKAELIKTIQQAEGNFPCYASTTTCTNTECLWHADCKKATR